MPVNPVLGSLFQAREVEAQPGPDVRLDEGVRDDEPASDRQGHDPRLVRAAVRAVAAEGAVDGEEGRHAGADPQLEVPAGVVPRQSVEVVVGLEDAQVREEVRLPVVRVPGRRGVGRARRRGRRVHSGASAGTPFVPVVLGGKAGRGGRGDHEPGESECDMFPHADLLLPMSIPRFDSRIPPVQVERKGRNPYNGAFSYTNIRRTDGRYS